MQATQTETTTLKVSHKAGRSQATVVQVWLEHPRGYRLVSEQPSAGRLTQAEDGLIVWTCEQVSGPGHPKVRLPGREFEIGGPAGPWQLPIPATHRWESAEVCIVLPRDGVADPELRFHLQAPRRADGGARTREADAAMAERVWAGPVTGAAVPVPVVPDALPEIRARLDQLDARVGEQLGALAAVQAAVDAVGPRVDDVRAAVDRLEVKLQARFARVEALLEQVQKQGAPRSEGSSEARSVEQLQALTRVVQSFGREAGVSMERADLDALAAPVADLLRAMKARKFDAAAVDLVEDLDRELKATRQDDPLGDVRAALDRRDVPQGLAALARYLERSQRAPLTADNLDQRLIGVSRAIWEAEHAAFDAAGAVGEPLRRCLAARQVEVILPEEGHTYQPKLQRVHQRRPARPGEALNRILEVVAPGFMRQGSPIEKAAVVITD